MQASHVIGQVMEQAAKLEVDLDSDEVYRCLWAGCKVHGKTSCSKSWLEKHVPTHGGKFSFACMIGGCKQRFSSQVRTSIEISWFVLRRAIRMPSFFFPPFISSRISHTQHI